MQKIRENICTYQKKVLPLHRQTKTNNQKTGRQPETAAKDYDYYNNFNLHPKQRDHQPSQHSLHNGQPTDEPRDVQQPRRTQPSSATTQPRGKRRPMADVRVLRQKERAFLFLIPRPRLQRYRLHIRLRLYGYD